MKSQKIKEKEKKKELHKKIVSNALTKFRARHPNSNLPDSTEELLSQYLSKLLEQGSVTETQLERFLKEISKRGNDYSNFKVQDELKIEKADDNVNSRIIDPISNEVHQKAQEVLSLPPIIQKRMAKQANQADWAKKLEQDQKEYQDYLEQMKLKDHQVRQQQKAFLDSQIKAREEAKEHELSIDRKRAEEEAMLVKKWKEDRAVSAQKRKEITRSLQKDLILQRDQALLRKEKEKTEGKEEAQKILEKMQIELQLEATEKIQQKQNIKKEIQSYLQANKQLQEARNAQKEAEEIEIKNRTKGISVMDRLGRPDAEAHILKRVVARQELQNKAAASLPSLNESNLQENKYNAYAVNEDKEELARKEKLKKLQIRKDIEEQLKEKEKQKIALKEEIKKQREEEARNEATWKQQTEYEKSKKKEKIKEGLKAIEQQLVEKHQIRMTQEVPIKIGHGSPKAILA